MAQQKILSSQLADSGVTPGAYTNSNVTVDAAGRITAIANGSAGSGTVSSINVSGGTTGLTTTGGPVTTSGTITITGTLATTHGGTGLTTFGSALQVLRVNAGATGLEYATISASISAPNTEIVYGTGAGVTSDPNFTFDSGTSTLTVAGAAGSIQSGVAQPITISADTFIDLQTSSLSRVKFTSVGEWIIDGTAGTNGYVLTSQGSGSNPTWQVASGLVTTGSSKQALGSDGSGGLYNALAFWDSTTGGDGILTMGENGADDPSTGNIITTFQQGGGNGRDGTNLTVRAADAFFPFDTLTKNGGSLSLLAGRGGSLTGTARNGTGGSVSIAAGASKNFAGGSVSIDSGLSDTLEGGDITITSADGSTGGNVIITSGLSTDAGSDGHIEISAGQVGGSDGFISIVVNGAERLGIVGSGSWAVNGDNGTAGQVLTSQGSAAPPTWTDIGGSFAVDLSAASVTFNGSAVTTWSATTIVPATFCHWDSYLSQLVFDKAGYYRVSIIAKADAGSPSSWPGDLTSFGTTISSAVTPTNTRHSATVPGAYPDDFQGIASFTSAPNQSEAVWTDTYVVSVLINGVETIGVYAANYLSSGTSVTLGAFVTVERLGDLGF